MIAHLCRLAWNRRRTHLLLVGELFLSFLVLTPLVVACVLFAAEHLKPLGFQHEGVWSVSLLDQTPPPPLDRGKDREQALAEAEAEYVAEYQGSIELVGRELRAPRPGPGGSPRQRSATLSHAGLLERDPVRPHLG